MTTSAFSLRVGSGWFKAPDGHTVCYKLPWCKPLRSEREGKRKPMFAMFGFRVFVEDAE